MRRGDEARRVCSLAASLPSHPTTPNHRGFHRIFFGRWDTPKRRAGAALSDRRRIATPGASVPGATDGLSDPWVRKEGLRAGATLDLAPEPVPDVVLL